MIQRGLNLYQVKQCFYCFEVGRKQNSRKISSKAQSGLLRELSLLSTEAEGISNFVNKI